MLSSRGGNAKLKVWYWGQLRSGCTKLGYYL